MKLLLSILLPTTVWLFPYLLSAQCDVGVDAGDDIRVCSDDNTVRLNGSVSGDNVIDFFWSPDNDLSTSTSLIPLVFLDGTDQTITLTVRGFDPADNLIINGDFEAGDSDFTTDYAPGSGGAFGTLSAEGQYAVDDNTGDTHNNFANCSDHTGGGNMMVVNGSGTAGTNVWCQTVAITPGTDYIFDAWVVSAISQAPAQLQFSINGSLIGNTFTASSTTCSWGQFNAPWSSGGSSSADICIVNQNTATSGNDFAIDDLYFGEVCEQTDEVNIFVVEVEALASGPIEIPCDGEVLIDASGSTFGTGIFYNWSTTDGNILSGFGTPVITVNQPGDYTFQVVFDNGNIQCVDEVTVTVTDDEPTALAVASTPGRVDCETPQIQISGIGSSSGPNWTYNWTTPDGNIVSGENTLNPTIDAGGTYEIVVFNTVSGCTAIEVITVDESLGAPLAAINPSTGIPCGADGINLDGSPSDFGPDITYEWTTTDGTIVSGGAGLSPLISSAGTYQLVVGQGSNGCTDTASIVITQEPNNLVATISDPDTLTCTPNPVALDGNGSSSGASVVYEWTTPNGNISSGTNAIGAQAAAAGTYVLTVRDTDSGCFTRDTVVVTEDNSPPSLALSLTDSLTCVQDTVFISASSPDEVIFSWTTNAGTILGGQATDSLLAGAPGAYFLLIEDVATGCVSQDTIVVIEQVTPPVADAGDPVSFTCGTDQAMLDGSNSSSGADFSYNWTTTDGGLVSGAGTQVPVINAVGSYFLEVTNITTGCTARDTVRILSDDQAPPVSISVAGNLDCNNNFRDLDASASASGQGFTFQWSTSDGNFLSGQNTLMPRIDAPGTYVLTVTDTINQCQGVRSVTITEQTTLPSVSGGPDFRLDCNQPTDTLSATGSSLGDPFSFTWATEGGSFVGSSDGVNPEVDSPGLYMLTITNTETGCTATDSVLVTESTTAPPATVGGGGEINCQTTEITLGNDPFNPVLEYSWTSPDGGVNGPANTNQLSVDTAGNYVLLVTDPDNGCFTRDSVRITYNVVQPTVVIVEPGEINCSVGIFNLDAQGSSSGSPFSLNWNTADGMISAGGNSLEPTITAEGIYTLVITDQSNFCVDSASVTVTGNVVFPAVEAGDPLAIDCQDGEAELSPNGSDQGAGFELFWSSPDGNFVGDPSLPNPLVDSAGVYYLTVRDTANGCVSVDSVVVMADFNRPEIDAGPNTTITCANTTVELEGGEPVVGYQYLWTTLNGNVISGEQASVATAGEPGNYLFRVTNLDNGCSNVDSVQVAIDTITPALAIAPPAELNCAVMSVDLTGSGAVGNTYAWTTANGTLGGATDQAVSIATAPGIYLLEVTDPSNGCQRIAEVTVGQNIAPPVFNLAPAAALTCLQTLRELSVEDLGPGFSYNWTTNDGNLLSGASGPNPEVDSAGTYVLTVRDENNFCTTTDSLTLERNAILPALSIVPPVELNCTVNQAGLLAATDLDLGNAEIAWTTENGTIVGNASELQVTATAAGDYQLRITNATTGCATTLTTAVTENRILPIINLAQEVDLGCFMSDFSLTADASGQGDLSYAWSTSGGTIVSGADGGAPVINGIGTYSLTVTDERNGCVASAEVFADQNLLEEFTFSQRDPSCERLEGTIQFGNVAGGNQPYAYSVDGGNNFRSDPVFQGLAPDNYVLVVRDANGCELEDVTSVVAAPDFQLEVDAGEVIDFGESIQLNARINFPLGEIDTIVWMPWDSTFSCSNCLNPRVSPGETQSYRVRVETVDGCVAEEFLTIIVNEENPVFFPTAFSPNGDGVNDTYIPFANLGTVARITSMSIFDRWGETVFFREDFVPNDPQFGWDGSLNGKPMNPQVLVFSVEVEFVNGERRSYKGDFALLR